MATSGRPAWAAGENARTEDNEREPCSRVARHPLSEDHVYIRGRRLALADLVDPRIFDAGHVKTLRKQMAAAQPFPHLTLDGAFHPDLLELVQEEFELAPETTWQVMRSTHEATHRSKPCPVLGTATQLYFGIVNSGSFVRFLSDVSGVGHLLPDPEFYGGGMHETRNGGIFDIHRDFEHHARGGLVNEMVFLTYLNRDWQPSNGGALELWDSATMRAARIIPVQFGCSVLLKHGPDSFHGHRVPWNHPRGVPRRSLASYYYSSPRQHDGIGRARTSFLFPDAVDDLIRLGRRVVPPVVWDTLVKLSRR
jgi:hypothetical protein